VAHGTPKNADEFVPLKRLPVYENCRLKTAIFIKMGEYVQKTRKSLNKIKGV